MVQFFLISGGYHKRIEAENNSKANSGLVEPTRTAQEAEEHSQIQESPDQVITLAGQAIEDDLNQPLLFANQEVMDSENTQNELGKKNFFFNVNIFIKLLFTLS